MDNLPKSLLSLCHNPVWTIPMLPFALKIKSADFVNLVLEDLQHVAPDFLPTMTVLQLLSKWSVSQSSDGPDPSLILCSWARHSPTIGFLLSTKPVVSVLYQDTSVVVSYPPWSSVLPSAFPFSLHTLPYLQTCMSKLLLSADPEEYGKNHLHPSSPPYLTIPLCGPPRP